MDDKKRYEVRQILDHFGGVPKVENDIIQEYCLRMGFEPITATDYEDYLYQDSHDKRFAASLPKVMAILSRLQSLPEYTAPGEREKVIAANDQLEIDICKLLEDEGILYTEIDAFVGQLGGNLKQMMMDVGQRINNAAGQVFTHDARKAYGDPLTVKALGEAHRAIATGAVKEGDTPATEEVA